MTSLNTSTILSSRCNQPSFTQHKYRIFHISLGKIFTYFQVRTAFAISSYMYLHFVTFLLISCKYLSKAGYICALTCNTTPLEYMFLYASLLYLVLSFRFYRIHTMLQVRNAFSPTATMAKTSFSLQIISPITFILVHCIFPNSFIKRFNIQSLLKLLVL